jgi:hypothetical protein
VQPVLGGRDDAGLVLAPEGVRRGRAGAGAGRGAVVTPAGTAGEAGRDAGDPRRTADQAAPGEVQLSDG